MNTHLTPTGMGVAAAVLAAVVLAGGALADDRAWNTPLDGNFDDGVNWDDGEQPAPGPDDTAIFDVGAAYTVTFLSDRATDRVHVRDGFVTFMIDAGLQYTLLNELSTTPGVAVGVGDGDIASLTLRGGGFLHGAFTDVGDAADAFGELTIDGGWLENDQQLNVGNEGVGFLTVAARSVALNEIATIGLLPGSYGEATVGGFQSEWTSNGALTVGKGGVGDLLVDDGGFVRCHDAVIGQRASARGSATVRGADTDWIIDGTLDVAMNGTGSLVIEDGAKVAVGDFATVGTFPGNPEEEPERDGALGDVLVDGAGSIWSVDGDLYVPFLGRGTLVMAAGGAVGVQGDFFPSLRGEDQVPVIFGLAHGDDYPFAAIDILGIVSKDADSPGAAVVLVDGFEPIEGDHFVLMRAAAGVDLMGLSLPDLPAGLEWLVTQTSTLLEITAVVGEGCDGDIDDSGAVDFNDLLRILDAWGPCEGCPEDLNGDDAVDFNDLLIVLDNWGPCP